MARRFRAGYRQPPWDPLPPTRSRINDSECLAQGILLENCRLRLDIVPANLKCPACGLSEPYILEPLAGHDPLPVVECPGCGAAAGISGGTGVESIELTIVDANSQVIGKLQN